MNQAVVLKSFQDGIAVRLDSEMNFEDLVEQVAHRFSMSSPFFRDAAMVISFEGRTLTFEEECRLANVISENSGIDVACIIGKDEENDRVYGKILEEYQRKTALDSTEGQFYRGNLKAGQLLETEASVIILGDVEKGASVISAGSIIVLGRLEGKACCNGSNEKEHYIAALEMTPQKLKIGDFKYIAEEKRRLRGLELLTDFFCQLVKQGERSCKIHPKMAYVENRNISLRPIILKPEV